MGKKIKKVFKEVIFDASRVGIVIILGGLILLGIIFYLLWDKFD